MIPGELIAEPGEHLLNPGRRTLELANLYLTPLNDDTAKEMNEIFGKLAETADERGVFGLFFGPDEIGQPLVLPPGVPGDRVAALRKAFRNTMNGPELAADARQMQLDIEATSGEELQRKLKVLYAAPDDIVAAIRKVYATN